MKQKSIYNKDYQKVLVRLKRAREEAGLTQIEAARLLEITQSTMSKCESGDRRIDIIELRNFARVYDKRMQYFLDDL